MATVTKEIKRKRRSKPDTLAYSTTHVKDYLERERKKKEKRILLKHGFITKY